ncbi:MAG: gliding motility-associated C-terminal domain-containing protein [Flavobacteriales bacterium]|nr:gliding motility-associated C-terminal domain-containing protein [Flavobacteriales bacterium]MCB9447757.1 gliding motility-associated C-terminal domain-containing protein [Flavobacteriales bacterium]
MNHATHSSSIKWFAVLLMLISMHARSLACDGNSMVYNGYSDLGGCVYRLRFHVCIDETNGKRANKGWMLSITGGTVLAATPNPLVNSNNGGGTSLTPKITGNDIEWGCIACMYPATGPTFIPILGNRECFDVTVDIQGSPTSWIAYGNLIGVKEGCVVDAPGSCDHPNCVSQSTTNGTCLCKLCQEINHGCIKGDYEYCCGQGNFPSFPTCCILQTSTSTVDILCDGDDDGSGTVTVSAGTGPYDYLWSNGKTTSTITGLTPGTYTVTTSSSDGCEDIQTINIIAPPPLTLSLTPTDIPCAGDNSGSITSDYGGGTPGYTYVWSNGATNSNVSNVGPGTYALTVTDANGCTITSDATVTEPDPLTLNMPSDLYVCSDDTPTSDLTCTPGGGTPTYTYNWSNGGTSATITVTNVVNTSPTYTVTITDANGCTITDQVTVYVSCNPSVVLNDTTLCEGECATVKENAFGGDPPYQYQWSDPSLSGPGPHSVCPPATTQYCVTITDGNNVTAEACMTVNINPPPTLTTSGTGSVCGQCNGSVSVSANSTGPYSYMWSDGCTSATCNDKCPGSYDVTVTDGNGCVNQASQTIGNIGGPTISASATDASCGGICDGTTSVTITSQGTPPYTYIWSNGCDQTSCTAVCAGTHTVTITDGNGCIDVATTTVTEPVPVVSSVTTWDETCGNCQGAASVSASGGIPGYQFVWDSGNTSDNQDSLCQGIYYVTVTDSHGCQVIDTGVVNNIIVDPAADFLPDPVTVSIMNPVVNFIDKSSNAITWFWDFGDSTTSTNTNPTHVFADTGCYLVSLFIENQYGCHDTIRRTVCVKDISAIYVPNVFTPNKDGVNDYFTVGSYNYCQFEMYIFDRWGNLIYSTTSLAGWDGTANGSTEIAQEDVYVWLIKAQDCNGEQWKRVGRVSLIR